MGLDVPIVLPVPVGKWTVLRGAERCLGEAGGLIACSEFSTVAVSIQGSPVDSNSRSEASREKGGPYGSIPDQSLCFCFVRPKWSTTIWTMSLHSVIAPIP